MTPEGSSAALPWHLRLAAWVCLVLSGLVGLFATQEAVGLFHLAEIRSEGLSPDGFPVDPVVLDRVWRAQMQALESMQMPRAMLMTALVACTGLTLVGAARLLWPAGLSRDAIRRLLSGTALAVGVLRTLDGAQATVVARRVGTALSAALEAQTAPGTDPLVLEMTRNLGPKLLMAGTIFQTVVVAGTFVLLSQYLRSERVRLLLAEGRPDRNT